MRTIGSSRETTWPVLRSAAIALIYEHGFESMSMRQLADSANMKQGSIYYYFKSKEELLFRLVTDLLDEILTDLTQCLEDVADPLDRLDTFVSRLVEWHVSRHQETFIARVEFRSLTDQKKFDAYQALRDRYDAMLDEILTACQSDNLIEPTNLRLSRVSIMTMITGITSWYDPKGPSSLEELTRFYVTAVRRLLGAAPTIS